MNPRQQHFAENRAKGLERQQSAVLAGYSDAEKSGAHVEKSPAVQAEIARLRAEAAENTGMTKEMVIRGLEKAANMAEAQLDPMGMIAAWRELGKMLGHYAPEVKKVEKGINKRDLLRAMDQLTDEELLRLAHGKVVEGEVLGKSTEKVHDVRPEQPGN